MPRALLHGASCSLLLFLLVPAVQRALVALVSPLAAVAPTDLLALAAATAWLGLAPRHLARRAVTAGMTAGFAALPLAPAVPPGSALALGLGAAAVALAIGALAWPEPKTNSPERRARGFRLRGLVAFGALLHPAAVLRALPTVEPVSAAVMAAAGLAAALALAFAPAPLPVRRRELLLLAALAATATTAAVAGYAPVVTAGAAHAALVVLAGRALVPAGGRRPRLQAVAAWLAWAVAAAAAVHLGGAAGLALAAVVALLALVLLPRPAAWRELQPSA